MCNREEIVCVLKRAEVNGKDRVCVQSILSTYFQNRSRGYYGRDTEVNDETINKNADAIILAYYLQITQIKTHK